MTKKENKTGAPRDLDAEANKSVAAMSYLWVLCLVPLLSKRDSKFAQFHAKQGLILFIISLFTIVPFFGQILLLILVVISALGLIKAYNGEWWEIPFVHEWSKKIKI